MDTKEFLNLLKNQKNISLNTQQKKAVLHVNGPALTLAVPGSGKTTIIVCRTAYLILVCGINPENILSLTFSKPSAIDMETRFKKVFPDEKVCFSTIHSFAFSVVREYYKKRGIPYKVLEENNKGGSNNKIDILKKIYLKITGYILSDEKIEELVNHITYIKNMMLDYKEIYKFNDKFKNFDRIYLEYEKYKKENNFIDFDDMLNLCYEFLWEDKELLEKYKKQYPYIQIDEAQDTSKIQNSIIQLLVYPNNNIFMVADDDQSIYGFRGAFPQALLNFSNIYKHAKMFYMEKNYRSTKSIVYIANEFIKENKGRYDKNINTDNDNGEDIEVLTFDDSYEQAKYLVKEIMKTKKYSDIAILYRNNLSYIELVEIFNRYDIPFFIRDNRLAFFKHWVMNDILSFLNLVTDYRNFEAFKNIYYKMSGFINKSMIDYVSSRINKSKKSIFEILLSNPELKQYQKRNIKDLEHKFNYLKIVNPETAIKFIEKDLGYAKYLNGYNQTYDFSSDIINNMISTLKIIASKSNTIEDFLYRINILKEAISKESTKEDKVILSTFHSAKGLEFPKVYMVDLYEEELKTQSITPENIEEERRLFYVAITRAKQNLKLIVIKNINNRRVNKSRFVADIEKKLSIKYSQEIKPTTENKKINNNDTVIHNKFGEGIVFIINDDTALVDFYDFGRREVDLKSISIKSKIKAKK